jgi:hypothetical protein
MTIDREKVAGSGIVVVTSRLAGEKREFEVEPDSDPEVCPVLNDIEHEDQLVAKMAGTGYKLTFVAGGSRADEERRFYFRRI